MQFSVNARYTDDMKIKIQDQWKRIPVFIRKPVAFVIGFAFIILAALTGWLPGPGGIPLFLIGIAILSTEFKWAKKIKDMVMDILKWCHNWYRHHRTGGMLIMTGFAVLGAILLGVMILMVF